MKRTILIVALFAARLAQAQVIPISGTVVDQTGKPVPFAFISDSQHPYATYSDQNGAFSLKADPASNLLASAPFHNEVKAKIEKPDNIKIVLALNSAQPDGAAAGDKDNNFFKPDESRVDHVESISHIGAGEQAMHGSRYLYENWVHGFAVTPKDSIKQDGTYLFNYDKVTGSLLFTRNRKTAMIVDKSEIKGFTLFDDNAVSVSYVEMPSLDKKYVEVLANGPKYKIYRTLSTKFIKANFSTNGFTTTGNNYDEYKDESTYYIVSGTSQPQKFEPRSKALKAIFAAEPDKVKKFLADNEGDIDDNYIKALGEYMNK